LQCGAQKINHHQESDGKIASGAGKKQRTSLAVVSFFAGDEHVRKESRLRKARNWIRPSVSSESGLSLTCGRKKLARACESDNGFLRVKGQGERAPTIRKSPLKRWRVLVVALIRCLSRRLRTKKQWGPACLQKCRNPLEEMSERSCVGI
jgi:hypothetical protein